MKAPSWPAVAAIAAIGAIGVEVWQWRGEFATAPTRRAELSPVQVAGAPAAAPGASEPGSEPSAVPADAAPSAAQVKEFDLESKLHSLFGRNSVLAMMRLEHFPRRVVATVDNLGRSQAPPALWPVLPAGGRFSVETRGDVQVIAAVNERRYTPYMVLIEMVDMRKVFALYLELYPRLQKAYEELGYPRRSFNRRLVEVIDLLLATPQIDAPLRVELPEVQGPVQPQSPWLLYRYEDPILQSLSSGQKILLRMGPVNGQRLRANLAEIRELVTSQAAPQ